MPLQNRSMMKIYNTEIKPGEDVTLKIPVANLPSGTPIQLFAHIYRSQNPGPTMLVIGGIHGDEINGLEIVRRTVKSGLYKDIQCGSVIAVPLLNVYGFINFSRDFPDGKDVNRSFPGSKTGSLASRIAYTLTHDILPLVDFGLDFHTGGASIYNYPQVRVYRDDPESVELAHIFSMPHIIKTGLISKSLRKICHQKEIPLIVFEGGESLRMDEFSIEEGIKGIKRVMKAKGMLDVEVEACENIIIESNTWIRASKSGILQCLKVSGERIKRGEILGLITDPYGNMQTEVRATKAGIIYGHNNRPVVSQGDALFHIGFEK